MAIKILGNTIIDNDQNINCSGTAKFKVTTGNGVEVQTIGGNETTKFPFIGKNTSGTTTFSVDGDGNVAANTFIGDGSNLTGISGFSGSYNDLSNKPEIPDSSQFLRSDTSDSASGSISFTNSYYGFGNSTGSVSNDGGWNARVNIAGSSHARLDVKSVSDGIITTMYSHTGHAAGRVGTTSNHRLILMCNGNERASLSTSGTLSTTQQGTLWGSSNDGAGSGLDADNLDGYTWGSSGKNVRATEFYADSWFRNYNANQGLYNQATGAHFYSQSGNGVWNLTGNSQNVSTSLIFRGTHAGNVEGWLHADGGNYFGLLNDAGQWALKQFKVDGYSPNLWFDEESNEAWTGNPGNDEGKIEYHSNRFYIASGANSTEVVRFRRSSTDVGYIANDGNMYLTSGNYKVYHTGNKPTLATLGYTGATNANYITHTSQLTNNSGFLTSIPSTVVQYNPFGNVNISGIIQGKSFRCRAGENGEVKNTFNIEWSPGRNGRLWIGTTDVGQLYLSSDYRLKRNITPMSDGALDRIKMINPVSYQWNDFERDGVELSTKSEEINEGFIAHELQQIIPSAVDGEKDDPVTIQSLKPDAIIAVAVKAIQELSAKNDALEARLAQLESN